MIDVEKLGLVRIANPKKQRIEWWDKTTGRLEVWVTYQANMVSCGEAEKRALRKWLNQ